MLSPDDIPMALHQDLLTAANLRLVADYLRDRADLASTVEQLGGHWGSAGKPFMILSALAGEPKSPSDEMSDAVTGERWRALQSAWHKRWRPADHDPAP